MVRSIHTGGGSVWLAGTPQALWVSNGDDGTGARVDPATNRTVATIQVGRRPADSGIVGGDVWVPNREGNTLSRIDPATNRVVETVDVGTSPFVVPDHRSELWIGSWGGGDVWRLAPSP